MNQDVRWKQRFENFDRAFTLLHDTLMLRALEEFSDLELEGLIQRFMYTFELAWKTMKDFLEASGVLIVPVTPKAVIKEAFAAKLIDNGQGWIDMMLERNLLSHTYDEQRFRKALLNIRTRWLPLLKSLRLWMQEQYKNH
ncbi:MAG: nucleotidyltransferase [Chlorobiaceae bacterium]|nr:nucleotidyltransferase [Chlorobiaceae bacterium]